MLANNHNWAGNYAYRAARLHHPETVPQIQELVRRATRVKALGSRHSFNDIADTSADQIALDQLEPTVELDHARRTVSVAGGVRYGQLCAQLHHAGYALPNLASLPHISIAGACATATHGSGIGIGNLATVVSAIELVIADGELVRLSRDRDGDVFDGAVVNLGALGVVTKLTLDLVPAFTMRQDVYERLPRTRLDVDFEAIMASGYSVSLFTDWRSEYVNQVWVKRHVADGAARATEPEWFGAMPAPTHRHPIINLSAQPCTEQMGIPGPWYQRLPHFRMEFTPSTSEELQTEYMLPRHSAIAAIHALERLRDQVTPLLQISEIRTIAADRLWMSPCYGQDCVAIHFTWKKHWEAVQQLLPRIEDALEPFDARPHWGKLFAMAPARVQSLYARLPEFRRLLDIYDPTGKFRNAFVDSYIGERG